MSESPRDKRLAQLLIGLTDGQLNESHLAELRTMVQGDADCRAAYIDHMTMHAMLEFRHGGTELQPQRTETESLLLEVLEQERVARIKREAEAALAKQQSEDREAERRSSMRMLAGLSKPEKSSQTRHYVIPKPLFYGSIAAVVAVTAMIIWPMVNDNRAKPIDQPPIMGGQPELPPVVAKIEHIIDGRWADVNIPMQRNHELRAGSLQLAAGFVQVRMNNNALVTIEAPATFDLIDDGTIALSVGRLAALCPEGSEGFTVNHGDVRIVDLGTEFGVGVNEADGSLDTFVFDGEVTLGITDATGELAAKTDLQKHHAGKVDHSGAITLIKDAKSYQPYVRTPQEAKDRLAGLQMFDDFERDTSHQYKFIDSYNSGGKFNVAGGTLNIQPGQANTATVVLSDSDGVLRTGTRWGIDLSDAQRPAGGQFIFVSTSPNQPGPVTAEMKGRNNALGLRVRRGNRQGFSDGNMILLEMNDAPIGEIRDPGGAITLWIERKNPSTLAVFIQREGKTDSTALAGPVHISGLASHDGLYLGIEAFSTVPGRTYAFDNLRFVEIAENPLEKENE